MKCRCPKLSTQNAEFPADIAHVIRTNENHLQADKQPGIAPNAAFTRHTTELRPPPLRSPSNKQPPMPNNFAPVSTALTALSRRFSVIEVQRRPRNQERLTLIYRRRKNLQAVQLLGHTKLENTVHYLGSRSMMPWSGGADRNLNMHSNSRCQAVAMRPDAVINFLKVRWNANL